MRKVRTSIILFALILFMGVTGYSILDDMTVFEALYMTVITIATVGFGEVKPLSTPGRVLTIFIIAFGVFTSGYTIGTLLRMLIEGEVQKTYERRRLEKKIAALRDHYIVCGFGRIGGWICQELHTQKKNFVVIDNDPEVIKNLEKSGYLYLPMDASSDEALTNAGIKYARALVTAVSSDADNVYITLTARGVRPDIFIVARSSSETSETKLRRAGATKVVSPYYIGGKRMAQVLLRPTVVDFIDIATMEGDLGLLMEEVPISTESCLAGLTLVDSHLRRDFGVIIVMIRKHHGQLIFNPQPSEVLEKGDVLVMLGRREDMEKIRNL